MSEPTKPITDSIDSLAIEADCARLKYESALRNSLIAARKEVERLRKALEWYAREDISDNFRAADSGDRAREALHPTQPAEGREK